MRPCPQNGLTAVQMLSNSVSPQAGTELAERAAVIASEKAAAEAERQRCIRMARLDSTMLLFEQELSKLEARSATI